MAECTNPHPERPELNCEIRSVNHPRCTAYDLASMQHFDWVNPHYVEPRKGGKAETAAELRTMAERVPKTTRTAATPPARVEGFPAAVEGSESAARRWDDDQKQLVDAAIAAVARRCAGGKEFTADDIWAELAGSVPVTKGLTSRLLVADRAELIGNTGKTVISRRGGDHDHAQRLAVWYSLVSPLG